MTAPVSAQKKHSLCDEILPTLNIMFAGTQIFLIKLNINGYRGF